MTDSTPDEPKVHVTLEQVYEAMTLDNLRYIATQRHIHVDGRRPSRCSKAELIAALS